ncbi:TetR/AcrR family transcriptional regulator [Cryomorphaceae bacterium 1068]|nr:TetR/AcrR family transcriptional regulator [Cryomorphaceae bacterium 1068]
MSEFENTRQLWIEKGYEQFALFGPEYLSINKLSKAIGFSRASFYHHFGDIDVFTEELLNFHWQIAKEFNRMGKENCINLFPDLYDLLGQNPIPLQFSLQLFHHRSQPTFNYLFVRTYQATAKSFALKLFSKHFDLAQPSDEVYLLWLTFGEAWYSRLTPDDLTSETLQHHAQEILRCFFFFKDSTLYPRFQSTL